MRKKKLTSHDRKHLKRLRTGLLSMRERIIKRLEGLGRFDGVKVQVIYFDEDGLAEKREEVKEEKVLIKHIDPILERIQRTLGVAPLLLEPPPRVTFSKYKPKKKKKPPKDAIEGTFTIER